MVNLAKKKFNLIVFILFTVLIFVAFRQLFQSYFEADEWFHFSQYLPLTRQSNGFLTALVNTILNNESLSGGQHINPLASVIYFLNTKFFGLNYVPYAFMSLLLHSINSFLVFLLIKTLLRKKPNVNIFAILGGIFFALTPQPIHTITGAAPFYGENILSVTLVLLCILSFKLAYIKKNRKYLYLSLLCLFLALFSKETAGYLFLLLPVMAIIEKRIFSLKFLGKVFAVSLIAYFIFRFVIPNFYTLPGKIIDIFVDGYIPKSYTQPAKAVDTGTIVSRDLSIHKNLPAEILFRTITFPIKMTGTLFLPRETVFSVVNFITPIVQPVPPGGDSADSSQVRLKFLYGPGNGFIIYIVSLVILIFCVSKIFRFVRRRQIQEAQTLVIGLAIIIISALPLVLIIFSFPRWGYDFYFDSRYNYHPSVGAAIVFPFLLFGIAEFLSKKLRTNLNLLVTVLFIIWLINNMNMFNLGIKQFTRNFQPDRREVVAQLKKHLQTLPKKTIFYIETDGLSAYGPILPFQTGVPQALTVVYYDKNHLPDSFFSKTLFEGKSQGYSYFEGRGFGYYISKKNLSEALILKKFEISDIHAFYYKSLERKLLDKTLQVRKEMQNYLENTDILNWKEFNDSSLGIKFLYPQSTKIENLNTTNVNTILSLLLRDPQFSAEMSFINVSPAFNLKDNIQFQILNKAPSVFKDIVEKDVFFDKYRFNKAMIVDEDQSGYFMKFNGILIYVKITSNTSESKILVERILGSLEIIYEK